MSLYASNMVGDAIEKTENSILKDAAMSLIVHYYRNYFWLNESLIVKIQWKVTNKVEWSEGKQLGTQFSCEKVFETNNLVPVMAVLAY